MIRSIWYSYDYLFLRTALPKKLSTTLKTLIESSSLPFSIRAVVVFGSTARGRATESSDVDLLVVAEDIPEKLHRRAEEIVRIKHHFPGLPLDVLLLTPEETRSNFNNHNPLFLDIAEEGVILIDADDFLRDLVQKTKAYIRSRGIKKFHDAWKFPVEAGVATYLSEVSNQDFSSAMLKDGERDFVIGNKLLDDGFYDKAVYHFQQAVEKCVKAVLIALGVFQKTHFVGQVLRELSSGNEVPDKWKNLLLEAAEISEAIEPEISLSRYPGIINNKLWLPFDEYEKQDADGARQKAEKTLFIAKQFTESWFKKK